MTNKKGLGNRDPLSGIEDSREKETVKQSVRKSGPSNTRSQGLAKGYVRASFVVSEDYLENIKDYAALSGLNMKESLNKILADFFEGDEIKKKLSQFNKLKMS